MSRTAAGRLLVRTAEAAAGPSTSAGWVGGGRAAFALARATETPSGARPSSSLTTTDSPPAHTSVARSLIVDTLNLVRGR